MVAGAISQMPLPNYHTARLKDPKGYDRIATKKDQGGNGIDFLIGFKGDSSDVISIHFRSAKFTTAKAKTWLTKHKFPTSQFVAAKKPAQEGAPMPTTEALKRELSFGQVCNLLYEELCHEYPCLSENGMPMGGCRYYPQQVWVDKALIRASEYYQEEDDAKFALVYFTVASDQKSLTIDKSIPVQIIASPLEEGESPVVIDESRLFVEPDDIQEAGKRNSTSDKKKLNAAMRAMMDTLDDDDIEEETMSMMDKRMTAKKKKAMAAKAVKSDMKKEAEGAQEGKSEKTEAEVVTESVWDAMAGETIKESFLIDLSEAKIDEENQIIRGTTILGPVSLNKRRYAEAVQREATSLFEGTKAYLNHPPLGSMEARDVEDFIGIHKNVRVVDGKMRSDLHLINNETTREHVFAPARKFPDAIGNSIVARVVLERAKDGFDEVTKILAVRSVDLVTEPGTTNGLFESQTQESHPATTQEDTMDMKSLALETLKAERPDLVEALLAEQKKTDEVVDLKAQVEKLTTEAKEKEVKLAAFELKESARLRNEEIAGIVAKMKTPDSFKYETREGETSIRSTLRNVLDRCRDGDEMKAVIVEWEAICADVKPAEQKPLSHESTINFGTNSAKVDTAKMSQVANALIH